MATYLPTDNGQQRWLLVIINQRLLLLFIHRSEAAYIYIYYSFYLLAFLEWQLRERTKANLKGYL